MVSDPVRRPLVLLAFAMPDATQTSLEEMSIMKRNALLLRLWHATFGSPLRGLTHCSVCGRPTEFSADLGGLLDALHEDAQSVAMWNGCVVKPVNSRALLRALDMKDVAEQERALLLGCVEDGACVTKDSLDELRDVVSMQNQDAEMTCRIACAECGVVNDVDLDPAHFLWLAVKHCAASLLSDVHEIASTYGWAEDAVLAMSAVRREAYLERIGVEVLA